MTRKELRQRLEALGARAVWALFALLPLDAASGLGPMASPRVQLAILALAGTSEQQLAIYVEAAKSDDRDVLAWAYCGYYPERPTGRVELQE